MFKRRAKRSWLKIVADFIYPRGGWSRAASYIGHRLRRLPDSPQKIARGIGAGVFISFTPFFGFHFVLAVIAAIIVRGNMLAAVLATFFGNPLTFPFIAAVSFETGLRILGRTEVFPMRQVFDAFADASVEMWWNFKALFNDNVTRWESLSGFFDAVFLPYLVGGLGPGLIAGIVCYFLSEPVIRAYQKHRRKKLRRKWDEMRQRKEAKQAREERARDAVPEAPQETSAQGGEKG